MDIQEKIEKNVWDHLDDFLKVHRKRTEGKWSWAMNSKCKYVDLRVDMRDGGCIIMDRHGNRISPERLGWQYSKESEQPPE